MNIKDRNFLEFKEYYSDNFPYYEPRPQQKKMMERIFYSIINKKNLVVEAPTGVGKTLSYLLPSLYFAKQGKRVMILTETIDQQERIFEDLNSLKHDLKVSFMMGKGNFYCKAKEDKANRLYCQYNKKCTHRPNKKPYCNCGTKKETIKITDEDPKYYCPFCICDYQKAKIQGLDADIVVMNNSIYYYIKDEIDVKRNTDIIICDEAHKLEGSIRNSATISINPDNALNRLRIMAYNYAPNTIKKYIKRLNDEYEQYDENYNRLGYFNQSYNEEFWNIVNNYVSKYAVVSDCKNTLIFDGERITSFGLKDDVAILGTLLDGYNQIIKIKNKINLFEENRELRKKELDFKIDNKALVPIEFQYIFDRRVSDMPLMEFLDSIKDLKTINSNFVIYKSGNNNSSSNLLCEPVAVSNYLKNLYNGATVIHCSATLGNLKIHALKTGMGSSQTLTLDSPFSEHRRKIIALRNGEEMKYDGNKETKRNKANNNILKLLKSAKCNSLVLFKSFEDLNSCYAHLLNNGNQLNQKIYTYEAGMDGKEAKELKEKFEKEGGILLATGRFAEGVDIPREALTMVIIDSLPFPVPTPLINREQKMIEDGLKRKKVNNAHWTAFLMTSFHIMSRTIIQMIGRLIRTEEDYGIVVIQDKRFNDWVADKMKERGYLKYDCLSMNLNDAEEFIPRFFGEFRNK